MIFLSACPYLDNENACVCLFHNGNLVHSQDQSRVNIREKHQILIDIFRRQLGSFSFLSDGMWAIYYKNPEKTSFEYKNRIEKVSEGTEIDDCANEISEYVITNDLIISQMQRRDDIVFVQLPTDQYMW